ncbi:MFS transporter, partial [Streptomyces sp. TRM76130]|nr:MFS transporter [Streptomyces sp. TRM76130]
MPGTSATRTRTLWYPAGRGRSIGAVTETLTSPPARPAAAPSPVLGGAGLFTVLLGAALPLVD